MDTVSCYSDSGSSAAPVPKDDFFAASKSLILYTVSYISYYLCPCLDTDSSFSDTDSSFSDISVAEIIEPVDPSWAPKEPVLWAAPIRTIYNLKFRLAKPKPTYAQPSLQPPQNYSAFRFGDSIYRHSKIIHPWPLIDLGFDASPGLDAWCSLLEHVCSYVPFCEIQDGSSKAQLIRKAGLRTIVHFTFSQQILLNTLYKNEEREESLYDFILCSDRYMASADDVTVALELKTRCRQYLSEWDQCIKEKGLEDAATTWMSPFSTVS